MKSVEFNFERDIQPLSYFAGRICHDLNNLITSSMGAVSLLELKMSMMPSVDLETEMERVNKSIANYRTFTQRLSNIFLEISPNKMAIDFNLVLTAQPDAFPENVIFHLLESPCKVNMDATQIPLALKEIIFNAMESSKEPATIEVTATKKTDEDGHWVYFTCTDHGRGINENSLDQVFTPFFSEGKRGNLVGLGLAQAGHILYQHGSTLKVSSESGVGTIVEFKLKAEPS